MQYLATRAEPALAFALLNSSGDVDIESFAWGAVPEDVRNHAIAEAVRSVERNQGRFTVQASPWSFQINLIRIAGETWSVVIVNTKDPDWLDKLKQEDWLPDLFGVWRKPLAPK